MQIQLLLLALAALPAASQTLTSTVQTQFGPIDVAIENAFGNRIVASFTNRSSVRIAGIEVEARFKDPKGNRKWCDALPIGCKFYAGAIDPGSKASDHSMREMKLKKGDSMELTVSSVELQVDYRLEPARSEKSNKEYTLAATLQPAGIALELTNLASEPIQVVWDECSFIDATGRAHRIFHNGVKYTDRENHQQNTVVPPSSRIEDVVVPTDYVHFLEGSTYVPARWESDSLLPEKQAATAEGFSSFLTGKDIRVFVQLLVAGSKVSETANFRIAEASVSRKLGFFKK